MLHESFAVNRPLHPVHSPTLSVFQIRNNLWYFIRRLRSFLRCRCSCRRADRTSSRTTESYAVTSASWRRCATVTAARRSCSSARTAKLKVSNCKTGFTPSDGESRSAEEHWTVGPWPPDLTSGPPTLALYWRISLVLKNNWNISKYQSVELFSIFVFWVTFIWFGPPRVVSHWPAT